MFEIEKTICSLKRTIGIIGDLVLQLCLIIVGTIATGAFVVFVLFKIGEALG